MIYRLYLLINFKKSNIICLYINIFSQNEESEYDATNPNWEQNRKI